MDLRQAIARVCGNGDLSEEQMAGAVGQIMDGEATPGQIGALLVGLRMKGETVDEITGAARAMRARAEKFAVPEGVVVDTCGTGGDGAGTINVSTLAALVVAACGVRVAKHGNRAQSSRAGSADVLEALGVDVGAPVATVERCVREVGIGFLFAPAFHGATRHAAPVRKEIGVRTIFNLLGPLTNPAGSRHQLLGVYAVEKIETLARALGRLGAERALVVHGAGGLDEFAPAGETQVAEWRGKDVTVGERSEPSSAPAGSAEGASGRVVRYALKPRDFELEEEDAKGLQGGDAEFNAMQARALLDGERGAARAAVVMTAAAALYVAGVGGLRDGARRAERAIDEGAARAKLEALAVASKWRGEGA